MIPEALGTEASGKRTKSDNCSSLYGLAERETYMSSDLYALTPLNLALDGSLDLFLEAYRSVYDVYLKKIQDTPILMEHKASLDLCAIPEILPILEFLVFKRLRIFTTKYKHIDLKKHHLKRFSFFNETRVEEFQRNRALHKDWSEKGYSFADQRYLQPGMEEFEFRETAITLEHFLKEFQRIVIRAIHEETQKENPDYTIFAARGAVESRVAERMKQSREECLIPKADKGVLTSEPLYVYETLNRTGCKINKHPLAVRKYYAPHTDGKNIMVLPTHYCEACDRYMIGSLTLSLFKEFGGAFIGRTIKLLPGDFEEWSALGESKLHQLGYNAIDGKLSTAERQNLLITILEGKQLTFFEIIATLEQNIHMFESNPRMQKAVTKWRCDLTFMNSYVLNQDAKS